MVSTSKPSIADVARLAGVSTGTVSNALNHSERVKPETIKKVLDAVEKLNYRPNSIARSLAEGRNRSIGMILPDVGNSLFVDMARGAEAEADRHGFALMIANSDSDLRREERYVQHFVDAKVAGLLLAMNDDDHYATLSNVADHSIPTGLLNLAIPSAKACSVSSDNELGGWLATSHLAEIGRKRLVFVGGPHSLRPVRHRWAGFERAVQEHNLDLVYSLTPKEMKRSDGWLIGLRLAEDVKAGKIDGVVASTDLLAAGILQAFASIPEIEVPRDVAVVGYDNNQAAWDAPVPITTVAQPGEEIGRTAMSRLFSEMNSPEAHHHECVELEPTLIVRESTVTAAQNELQAIA